MASAFANLLVWLAKDERANLVLQYGHIMAPRRYLRPHYLQESNGDQAGSEA